MKKLLTTMIIIEIINLILMILLFNKTSVDIGKRAIIDSVINKVRIDSIELVITKKDSNIIHIKNTIENEIKEANSLNDSAVINLFERLVLE